MSVKDGVFDGVLYHIAHHFKDHPDLDVVEQLIFEMATHWPVPCKMVGEEAELFLYALLKAGPLISPSDEVRADVDQRMGDHDRVLLIHDKGTYVGTKVAGKTHVEWYPPNLTLSWKEAS